MVNEIFSDKRNEESGYSGQTKMGLQIELQNISKKYANHYIIKDFSYQFTTGNSYALLGSNGSGKSTLVRLLSGLYTPSKGKIVYTRDNKPLPVEQVFNYITLAAPWSDVIEDFTLRECISFQLKFKKPIQGITLSDILLISGLEHAADKFISQFSSGMKQRVRILLAVLVQSELLLLDEPTSNLDAAGKRWYLELIEKFSAGRMVVVASNHLEEEYSFCKQIVELK
jgi:ABC-type multidrug transport system ATPase subunit